MNQIRDIIRRQIQDVVSTALFSVPEWRGILFPDILIETPKEKTHGDFSTNIAMAMARVAKASPMDTARILIGRMSFHGTYILRAECVSPGFINFFCRDEWLYRGLRDILQQGKEYGSSDKGKGIRVMVEFVSANPTGPLHIGNARGGALGDLIANVLKKTGYEVTKEFYINDSGSQIEKFALSLSIRYLQEKQGIQSVDYPKELYQGEDIMEHVRRYILQESRDLSGDTSEERGKILAEYALPLNIAHIRETLERYGITYDVWFSEESLYRSGTVNQVIERLWEQGMTEEYDGALWIKGNVLGVEKDEVLIRGNHMPTYFAADIAYHWNKFHERGFHQVINLLGADHHGHAGRMRGISQCIGISPDKLKIVIFQLVRLIREGEIVRMSKRTGKAITLEDLLDEVGVDAARFFFNTKSSGSHLDFDLDLAVRQSSENPVYYVQYAHARICSMLAVLRQEGVEPDSWDRDPDFTLLSTEQEKDLIKKLCSYPEEMIKSAETLEPSRLTRYAVDLAALFHSFYTCCRVKGEALNLLRVRLALVQATRMILQDVLEVLGIQAPEKM